MNGLFGLNARCARRSAKANRQIKRFERLQAQKPVVPLMLDTPLNCAVFTQGQGVRRIVRYGTDIKEEDLKAIFA
jgi:hypothetical protein